MTDSYPLWIRGLAVLLSPFKAPGYSIKTGHTEKFDYVERRSYKSLRGDVRDGDLLFCKGEYAFSKVIRYLSGKSKVSHVGIVYWWLGRLMVLESVESDGVRVLPVSQYLENYENSGKPYKGQLYLAREKRIDAWGKRRDRGRSETINRVLAEAANLLNKKFSARDVITFFVQGCTGRFKHRSNDELICSEFVAQCYLSIGLAYEDDGCGFIAPEHIAKSESIEVIAEIV